MDSQRRYIYDQCRIGAGHVHGQWSWKRRCEVSSFKEECKAPWNVKIKEDWAEIDPLWFAIKAGRHSQCKIGWLVLAYTASTVRFVTFAVLFSVTWPICRFTRVYEGQKGRSRVGRPCCGKLLEVIGLHDFRCYLRVASKSLTPQLRNLQCSSIV